MRIDIKKHAGKGKSSIQTVLLKERLPFIVDKPVELSFSYTIENKGDFYLLQLEEEANIHLICQRCTDEWIYPYHQMHKLAVCADEKAAQKYQTLYDVLVFSDLNVDIDEVLVDNLHLFLPENHEKVDQCNKNQLKLIQND
jgi:uncharacterized protein